MQRNFLILDDNKLERQIIRRVLIDAFPSSEVIETADANEAREACAHRTISCFLVDYNMPQTDGIALSAELRLQYPNLPIVLVTGVGDELLVAHAIRNGINDYIPKGKVNVDSLQRTVERAIQSCDQARIIQEQREELENFAYALAHDFKQPIRQIRTFSQIVAREARDGDSEGLQQHLAFLEQASRRLSNLVDVMSQYTLLNQPPALAPVTLNDVFSSVRQALAMMLEDRDVELTISGGDIVVNGNETLLTQVLQNLVANGVKYNSRAAPCVDISVDARPHQVVLAIRDNGIGIDKQYQQDIFRPLVRLHASSEYEGTGLGLTLARKAVLAQGGTIWCESVLGEGSTFFVKLARARVAAPAEAGAA